MSEEYKKTGNVIKGPWGLRPIVNQPQSITETEPDSSSIVRLTDEESDQYSQLLDSLKDDGGPISELLRQLERDLVGAEDEFMRIYATALEANPLEVKVLEQIEIYKDWSKAELLSFANNTQNHQPFKTKPALVLAIHRLLITN